ncbi:MAG TPA: shikimate dehydrogenase [Allosphingosinicella sp.]|jgi:shikimate dehydrogenase
MPVPYAEVIGDPIAHSKSPLIHQFWLGKLGIKADYRRSRVSAADLPSYLKTKRADPWWLGCNVTAPLKQLALPHVDWLQSLAHKDAPLAAGVGALNAIVRGAEGRLAGFNTDVIGVLEALDRGVGTKNPAHALSYIIGAGGAARAATVALDQTAYGSRFFFNRTPEKAQAMSSEFRGHPGDGFGLDRLNDPTDADSSILVVNATPMGMVGHPPVPIDFDNFPVTSTVLDMVYEPIETPLIAAAKRRGLSVIDGMAMLIGQAAPAFQLFFGAHAPREHDEELRRLLTS